MITSQCRLDGRCQYAIDHGAEGVGSCPAGKCAMPMPFDILKVERAFQGPDDFVGYRLTVGGKTLLVFSDQEKMPGFRLGNSFCPDFGHEITYHECQLGQK